MAADAPKAEQQMAARLNGHRPTGAQLLGRVDPVMRDLVKEAIEKGGLLRAGSGKHPMKVICPDGETMTLSSSTSDWRARRNATAFFRRHGLEVGPRPQKAKQRMPANQVRAVERSSAWLALQPEDREFSAHDLGAELGLGQEQAQKRYLKHWLAAGKVHLIRYVRAPGQRGIGTPVYARRPALSAATTENWNATLRVLTPEAEAKVDRVLDRIVEPLAAAEVAIELNGHAAPQPAQQRPRGLMWKNISEALFLLAQAAEIAAKLEG